MQRKKNLLKEIFFKVFFGKFFMAHNSPASKSRILLLLYSGTKRLKKRAKKLILNF